MSDLWGALFRVMFAARIWLAQKSLVVEVEEVFVGVWLLREAVAVVVEACWRRMFFVCGELLEVVMLLLGGGVLERRWIVALFARAW